MAATASSFMDGLLTLKSNSQSGGAGSSSSSTSNSFYTKLAFNVFPFQSATVTSSNNTMITPPESPTQALDFDELHQEIILTGNNHSILVKHKKRQQKTKSVQFELDCKLHDGLTKRNEILDSTIKQYFVEQKEVSELHIMEFCEHKRIYVEDLHEDLQDILVRMEEALVEGKTSIPVLPKGGGMCTKLCSPHVPYVKILDRVVQAAANRLSRQELKQQQQRVLREEPASSYSYENTDSDTESDCKEPEHYEPCIVTLDDVKDE